jgi:hypothetical protein
VEAVSPLTFILRSDYSAVDVAALTLDGHGHMTLTVSWQTLKAIRPGDDVAVVSVDEVIFRGTLHDRDPAMGTNIVTLYIPLARTA